MPNTVTLTEISLNSSDFMSHRDWSCVQVENTDVFDGRLSQLRAFLTTHSGDDATIYYRADGAVFVGCHVKTPILLATAFLAGFKLGKNVC